MRAVKMSIVLLVIALALGIGVVFANGRGNSGTARSIRHPPTTEATKPTTSPTTASAATATANKIVQEMLASLAQLQPAHAANGGQPLTRAQVEAIVDGMNQKLGLPAK